MDSSTYLDIKSYIIEVKILFATPPASDSGWKGTLHVPFFGHDSLLPTLSDLFDEIVVAAGFLHYVIQASSLRSSLFNGFMTI